MEYKVSSVTEIMDKILPHFDTYPLITKKRADFELFKQIVEIISRGEHLTTKGLQQIVNLRASMNNGLSDKLKEAFPNTEPVQRPSVVAQEIKDPHWLAGFTDGEGCFFINTRKSLAYNLGRQVVLMFSIAQHSRDADLLRYFCDFFACGGYYPRSNRDEGNFSVTKFSDIELKIIPFFLKYPLHGIKALDFADFCKAVEIIKAKEHLTNEGLAKIEEIKSGMNTQIRSSRDKR